MTLIGNHYVMKKGNGPQSALKREPGSFSPANVPALKRDAPHSPETRFLTEESSVSSVWKGKCFYKTNSEPVARLPIAHERGKARRLCAYRADSEGRALLAPSDPVELLLRYRSDTERIRTAVGSGHLFDRHVLPVLAGWAALVQSIPRDASGLWSGTDGFFEAGLQFAAGSLNAADAHVLEPSMTPTKRAKWTDRVRVAALIAGLLSDAERFAGIRLEAGSVRPGTNTFEAIETFAPGEERVLAFGIRHAGRIMRLTRLTPLERAGRLPTLGLDFLRLAVPRETLAWLGALERRSGETVLTALKSSLMFGTGRTETERLLAQCVARGREWALNRRAARAAAREGRSPLLEGFAEVFRTVLASVIHDGRWEFNREDSPLIYAEDGVALRWPEGFVRIVTESGEGTFFREVPDEPDVAAEILAAAGVVQPDETGAPIRHAVSLPAGADPGGADRSGEWVKLADTERLVTLARRAAERRGECIPAALPPLFKASLFIKCDEADFGILPGRFEWRLSLPAKEQSGDPDAEALCKAVRYINTRPDAMLFGTVRGLFIPEKLLGFEFRPDSPAICDVFLKRTLEGGAFLGLRRETALHRVRVKGDAAANLSDLHLMGSRAGEKGCKTAFLKESPLILTGVFVKPRFIRPVEVWSDGTESERGFPRGTPQLEWIG